MRLHFLVTHARLQDEDTEMDDEEPPPPPDFVIPSGAIHQGPAGEAAGAVPAAPTDWGAMLTSLASAAQQALAAAAPQQAAPPPQQQATAPPSAAAAAQGEQAAGGNGPMFWRPCFAT